MAAAIPGGLQASLRSRSHLHHEMNMCVVFPHGVLIDTNEAFALTFSLSVFSICSLIICGFLHANNVA